ncbi:MAG: tetratricopeptide repeat protein [Proteobacteria bacterium]|nr:tetratricopeptide repeat protein [Pseudomonadota bacterium]
MNLWVMLVALCLVALFFGVWPVYRHSRSLTPLLAAIFVFMVVSSASLYYYIGNPRVPSGAGTTPSIDAMVAALAVRLEDNPDDANGWKMLARSYKTLQRFDEAIAAYERAVEVEGGQNAQTLVEIALVLVDSDGGAVSAQAEALLESALALDPNDPDALFYSGMAAARRGDTDLATDRWEMLSGLNAPPKIKELLQQKIAECRGSPPDC